jgi:hypothetical protein
LQRIAISSRKIGTVVSCPRCQGQLWVPNPADPNDQAVRGPQGEGQPLFVEVIPLAEESLFSWHDLSGLQKVLLVLTFVFLLIVLFGCGVLVGHSWRGTGTSF